MRLALMLVIAAALLAGAELKIDHVTVAGSSLKKLQADLSAVGIETVYGGAHSNGATEMALGSFLDGSYLELIATRPGGDAQAIAGHPWAKFMAGDAGPCAWAVREKDLAAEVQRLEAAGIKVSQPIRNGRARPDGVRLEWETAQVGTEPNGTFFPFLIHDFTPREQRAFPQGKATSKDFAGIKKVVIAVGDLEAATIRYRQAYGLPAIKQVDMEFGAHLATFGTTPVILAQPLRADSWLAARIVEFGEAPCAFILTARRVSHYKAAAKARWFGEAVSWLDREKLGWRLGFETDER